MQQEWDPTVLLLVYPRAERLGLEVLAYLWNKNQYDLVQQMISSSIHAILIKVASLGLHHAFLLGDNVPLTDYARIECVSHRHGLEGRLASSAEAGTLLYPTAHSRLVFFALAPPMGNEHCRGRRRIRELGLGLPFI